MPLLKIAHTLLPNISRFFSFFFCLLFLASSLAVSLPLRVTMINVGQGDSTLIETPSNQNILIDGGDKDQGTDKVIPLLQARGITTLHKMILTHNHSDHYSGLAEILKTGQFAINAFYHSEPFSSLNSTIQNEVNSATTTGHLGQVVRVTTMTPLDFGSNLSVNVLHADIGHSNPNNNSIVLKLTYNQISFLFTGDIELAASTTIVNHFSSFLPSTIVKVPHHGSKTGLDFSVNFPSRVNAKIGTVSASGGSFGLPDPEMISAYESVGTKILRTEKNGNITWITDGVSFSLSTSLMDSNLKGVGAVSGVHVYPNPIKDREGTFVYSLDGKADSVKIKIFTLSGDLVRSLDGLANEGSNFLNWDGKDEDGNELSSGLYLLIIEAKVGPSSVFGKSRFAVVRS